MDYISLFMQLASHGLRCSLLHLTQIPVKFAYFTMLRESKETDHIGPDIYQHIHPSIVQHIHPSIDRDTYQHIHPIYIICLATKPSYRWLPSIQRYHRYNPPQSNRSPPATHLPPSLSVYRCHFRRDRVVRAGYLSPYNGIHSSHH